MTGRQVQIGEVIALPRPGHGRPDDLQGATVPVRAERRWLAPEPALSETSADLVNVVPFRRPRDAARGTAPEVVLPGGEQAAPLARLARDRTRLLAFAAISLAVHAGLLAVFWREPDPFASIGVQVISLEIVVGANAPAGVATTPGENETQAPAAPTDPQPTEAARESEQKATEQPQEVPVAKLDAAPEEATQLERQPDEPQPNDNETAAKPEPQSEPKPSVAMVESPKPDQATATPRQTPPDSMDVTLVPQPEQKQPTPVVPKPVQQRPAPKQAQAKPAPKAEPKQRIAARPTEAKAAEPSRIAAPTRDRASERARASAPAAPANNLGIGRSDTTSHYRGLVAAHLSRYKQYPADARASGKTGTAAVTFTIGGGGGVTSVGLARSSGVPSIDQEVVSMVRRASPFPPPPGGRPQSFTVPVGFAIR